MNKDILKILYSNPIYLDYLRHHPKWYPYLESNPENFKAFEGTLKKDLKLTTYDRLEKMKKQVNFASGIMKYFEN